MVLFYVLGGIVPDYSSSAEVTLIEPISFGTIDFHPGGDTIRIAAASGPVKPDSDRSIVTGGKSGLIRIVSDNIEHVDIIYPSSITLSNGSSTLVLDGINSNSEYSSGGVDTLGSGLPLDVSIGGELVLSGDEMDGSYSGSMTITLNY